MFTPFKKKLFAVRPGLKKGWVSLDKTGTLRGHEGDFKRVGLEDLATVLVDPDTSRIGLRRPTPDEKADAYKISLCAAWSGRQTDRAQVSLRSALKSMGVDPAEIAGHFEITFKTKDKDGLLIIQVAPPCRPKPAKGKPAPPPDAFDEADDQAADEAELELDEELPDLDEDDE